MCKEALFLLFILLLVTVYVKKNKGGYILRLSISKKRWLRWYFCDDFQLPKVDIEGQLLAVDKALYGHWMSCIVVDGFL